MARKFSSMAAVVLAVFLLSGCPKGGSDFDAGKKAEAIQDYDTALAAYEKALKAEPTNTEYRLKATRLRFDAGQAHVDKGRKYRDAGELKLAVAEFEKASMIDPSSVIATQELRATMEMLRAATAGLPPAGAAPGAAPGAPPLLLEGPPELKPLSREPINLRVTNDARIVFETIAKLAGIGVIFDVDFQARRVSTDLTNVTLEDALDVVALQSRTFWKAVTPTVIMVVPDNPQKRKDFEDLVVKTFYLGNTVQPTDLTEIANGLRQLLNLRTVTQVNAQNALVIRDTPDKIALIEKILGDLDRAKPEVVVQISVLSARTDRLRDLGILPGSSAILAFTPQNPTGGTGTTTGGTTTQSNQMRLSDLQHLSSADYSITLPGATATALITDTTTKILQNPEIRTMDGQSAKLRVGDRVPIATGSFQAGVGVGGTTATGVINPLVNTQFQYQDVGVNVDITPRVHAATREVSLKISVEVSAVTGRQNIGGIDQPIISQRKIEHDVRLREGEVSVLGGLMGVNETKTLEGWPGLARIPFLRYFFSNERKEIEENEVLIVLTPRIVRLSELTVANLRSVGAGTDTNVQVRREQPAPPAPPPPPPPQTQPPAAPPPAAAPPTTEEQKMAKLRFDPASIAIKPGEQTTLGLVVEDVKDLFSIPILVQYDPKVISVEEVRHGGFLSGGTQEIAIVQRVDKEKGQAIISATRQPNTPGVNGTGTLLGVVIKGVAAGSSPVQILQVLARDSQGRPIALVTSEANVRVQ